MNQTNKYKTADHAAEVFCIAFFGVMILLAVYWLLNIIGEILVNIESSLF